MGTVAGAEPATKVTSLADWHTTQMCADACHVSVQCRLRCPCDVTHRQPKGLLGLGEEVRAGIVLTQHDQPLRLLHTVVVLLGIP